MHGSENRIYIYISLLIWGNLEKGCRYERFRLALVKRSCICKTVYYTFSQNNVISSVRKRYCALRLGLRLAEICFQSHMFSFSSKCSRSLVKTLARWKRSNLLNNLFQNEIKIKSSLYSLNNFSGVTSERCPSPRLCARASTSRLRRWRVVGNMWKIWLTWGLNHVPPVLEADVLPTCIIWPPFFQGYLKLKEMYPIRSTEVFTTRNLFKSTINAKFQSVSVVTRVYCDLFFNT